MNKNVNSIPIANIAYRLRRLQNFIDHDRYKDNAVIVPDLLEQAAKKWVGYTPTVKKLQALVVAHCRVKTSLL